MRCRLRLLFWIPLVLAGCTNDSGFVPPDGGPYDGAVDAPVTLDATPDVVDDAPKGNDAASCQGANPANACPTAARPCVPSGCFCSEGVWACTADCGGGRNCGDAGADTLPPGDLCTATGGSVSTAMCCQATADFPNTCAVGACGCAPQFSHSVNVCSCPQGTCFNPQKGCSKTACTPGMDQTCNDNPAISSFHGRCDADRTCSCTPPFTLNPATGRCR